jgi:hypothetical protein
MASTSARRFFSVGNFRRCSIIAWKIIQRWSWRKPGAWFLSSEATVQKTDQSNQPPAPADGIGIYASYAAAATDGDLLFHFLDKLFLLQTRESFIS